MVDPATPPLLPDEAARLASLQALGVLDTPPEPALDVITRLAADRFDTEIALVSLVDSNRQWFKSRHGLDVCETSRADSFCAHCIASDAVMVVPDATADPRFAANPLVTGAPHIRFYAAAPLITATGYRIGTLCVIDSRPHSSFGEREASALRLMAGQVIGWLESSRLEQQRSAAEAMLAQQLAAIEASDEGIAVTDGEGRFIFMNRAHATMFGYADASPLIGQPWGQLYSEAVVMPLIGTVPILAKAGRWRGEVRGRRTDGAEIELEVSLSLSSGGGIVCVARDMSERLAMEREKARLREQLMLAQRQEAVGQLASGIAHDFNNLIAAIAGTASLLEGVPDDGVRRHALRIQHAAGTATALVDKLLALGKRNPVLKPVDLRQLLIGVRDLVMPSLANASHRIELDLPDAPLLAVADETELMQVVLNLVLNARDALPKGQDGRIALTLLPAGSQPPQGEVMVGRIPAGPAALIRVSDTGCGIPPDELAQVFQPFFTRKGDAGTGLGLAVVAGIVASADGAIALSSQPGIGTSFELFWPLQPESGAWPARIPLQTPDADVLAGKAVLVVDDNPAVVDTLVAMLEHAGAEPGPCFDPADALTAVQEDPLAWDLVITDFDMPGMNGAVLAQELRRLRADLPVLLLSALPRADRRRAGDVDVFDAVLAKPASMDALVDAARTAMAAAKDRK